MGDDEQMRSLSTGLTLTDVIAEVGGHREVCRRVGQFAASGEITRAAVVAAELCLHVPVRRIGTAAVAAAVWRRR
ncbi:hypothetical protein [Nocardia cyriacigeorgica]|uniref:hypothetical protein n=1 Tax=Nocardia cyriacigeorgica TaxID=135487 RepID=UPI0035192EDD